MLGGTIDFTAKQRDGQRKCWTAQYLKLPEKNSQREMALTGIESERAAVSQYRMHMNQIRDPHVNAVLARIVKDEEYHIMLLQELAREN